MMSNEQAMFFTTFIKNNFNPLTSWRARIGLAFTLSTMVMIALLGYFFWEVVARQQIEDNIRGELQALAVHLIAQLDENLFERQRDIAVMANAHIFSAPDHHEPEEMRAELNRLRGDFTQEYLWIGFADVTGLVLAGSDGLLEGEDVSAQAWFTGGLEAVFIGDAREAVLLASAVPTPADQPLRLLDIAYPVVSPDGEPVGVLAAHLNLAYIHTRMRGYLSLAEKNRDLRYAILNRDLEFLTGDAVLLQQMRSALPSGQSGTLLTQSGTSGDAVISFAVSRGYRDYPGLGWTLVLQQETSRAFALTSRLQGHIVLFGAALALVFSGVGWLMAGRLTRPLVQIAEAADHIRAGDLSAQMPDIWSDDEVGRLSASLNALILDLTDQLRQTEAAQQAILQSQALEAELKQTQEHSQMKDAFISFLSHEARTPLAVIMSSASMLEDYFDRFSPERRSEHLQRIIGQGRYMTAMMEDLLIISRGRMGKLEFTPVPGDLAAYCRELVDEARQSAGVTPAHQFVIDIQGLFHDARFDRRLLRHTLGNLLGNAVKYSPDGGEIRLSLRRMPDPDGGACDVAVIRISDQGIGIPVADQSQLFEFFHRASNARQIAGTGLGLSIVRESVLRHGGTISFVSTEDQGTTFIITLPVFGGD